MRVVAITLVLLFFAWMPLAIIGYGALSGLLGGLLFLAPFIGVQVVVLRLMQRAAAARAKESRPDGE